MFAILLSLFLQLPTTTMSATAAKPASAEGRWSATLAQLRLTLDLSRRPDGKWSGTLTSIDQGNSQIPLDAVTVGGDGAVRFAAPSVAGVFEGKLDSAGAEIAGTWRQGTGMTLVFKRGAPAALKPRPQEPKRPFPYDEIPVAYENLWGAVKLAGTLTVPRGKAPFPAVLLITGSGAQNRDEEIFGHKPFQVLADYLARRGFVVLRVDDRGVGGSTGSVTQSTTADFAVDALTGVAFLKTRKEVDARRIGLIGHSEGGVIAPMAAAASKDVAFIVLMAGTGLDGGTIVLLQTALMDKVAGKSDAAQAQNRAATEALIALVRGEHDPIAFERRVREVMRSAFAVDGKVAPELGPVMEESVAEMMSPWFRAFVTLDPAIALRQVRCPVLALNGGRDLQVPPKENLKAIADALAGDRDVTTRELPGLNHLFQTAKSGLPSEYGELDETIAPAALKLMGDWLADHARRPVATNN